MGRRKKVVGPLPIEQNWDISADNKEFVMSEIKNCGLMLEYASQRLQNNAEVVLAAVTENGTALRYASPELRCNKAIVLTAVKECGLALEYCAYMFKCPDYPDSREVVTAAVSNCGTALKYAPEFQSDRRVVLAAVKNNGLALSYAPEFQNDFGVVLVAAIDNPYSMFFATNKLQKDPTIKAILKYMSNECTLKQILNKVDLGDRKVIDALAYARQNKITRLKSEVEDFFAEQNNDEEHQLKSVKLLKRKHHLDEDKNVDLKNLYNLNKRSESDRISNDFTITPVHIKPRFNKTK